jgi:hypothetical protein
MENKTRFDLSIAIQNWSRELAAEPDLTPEVCRELETHLRDTVAELQRRGLNDQESFWLARKRIGQPKELREEFVKANPERVWRERMLWIFVGLLAMRFWLGIPISFMDKINSMIKETLGNNFYLPDWVLFYVPIHLQWVNEHFLYNPFFTMLLRFLPFVFLMVLLTRKRLERKASVLEFILHSRKRFLSIAVATFGIYYTWTIFWFVQHASQAFPEFQTSYLIERGIAEAIISGIFIGLVAWLIPAKNRNPSKQT